MISTAIKIHAVDIATAISIKMEELDITNFNITKGMHSFDFTNQSLTNERFLSINSSSNLCKNQKVEHFSRLFLLLPLVTTFLEKREEESK
jgi:hypothetical protein